MKSTIQFLLDQEQQSKIEDEIDYFVLELPRTQILSKFLLNEGRGWFESGKKDWMVRVDPAEPENKIQRHAHIARSKHINNKNMQAAWNQDRSKHDKKTFNTSIGNLKVVQSIAKDALKLDPSIVLEKVQNIPHGMILLCESTNDIHCQSLFYRVK